MQVVLADPHTLMRTGLRRLVEELPGLRVCAEASDGQQLLSLVGQHHPDVVITEIALAGISGQEVIAQLKRHYPQVRVLVLAAQAHPHVVRSVLRSGASGYLVKDAELPELALALAALGRGQNYLSPRVAHVAMDRRRSRRPEESARLTVRQRQVLALVARGKSTKEIAHLMGVSVKTVETHRSRAMQSLGLNSINALMRYALSSGLDVGDA